MSTEETLDNDEDTAATSSESEPAAAESSELATEETGGAGKKNLGVDRWVQLTFLVAALLLVWFFDHVINAVWYLFADPNDSVVTVSSVAAGMAGAVLLYRNRSSRTLVHEVADELSKVTWPTRKETSSSTMIVVVTSIIAAVMLFLFDSVWSAVTDLVYKV